eukprot:scaffold173040_cov16-Tisochrysis_lutea.AAC.4
MLQIWSRGCGKVAKRTNGGELVECLTPFTHPSSFFCICCRSRQRCCPWASHRLLPAPTHQKGAHPEHGCAGGVAGGGNPGVFFGYCECFHAFMVAVLDGTQDMPEARVGTAT